ncbi:MAG: molybdopterin molybdotransferase MoeA [Fidelibacterota bacterium]|jgi:molybdopterin molybdotransferase|tara:strand:+ start:539 stop:1762 length:1224 start_codon:yes stop_codon:yes gene_type:complete
MISVNDAQSIIQKNIFELKSESVDLSSSSGKILSNNIKAKFPSPSFDNSAMDGFAVRSSDTFGATRTSTVSLKNIDESSAGSPSDLILKKGECIQCMTGAKIPKGADAIIMVEDTSGFSNDKNVQIMIEVKRGQHIRKMGEEINEGDILIEKGTIITTSEIGVCASFGYSELAVSKKPKVAIFATGNELIEPGKDLKEGEIYNSNLFLFADLVKKAGSKILMRNVIKDDKSSLKSFLLEALETCDVIISSGGVSMGRYDYVREVFIDLGVKEHFWKVAQKPGKPFFFGTNNQSLIFGLPGNPVSSYIGFMIWVWPVLKQLMGSLKDDSTKGILSEPFPLEKFKQRYLFGQSWIENGELRCKASTKIGSHMLSSALEANCILSATKGEGFLKPGDFIDVTMLPWKTIK